MVAKAQDSDPRKDPAAKDTNVAQAGQAEALHAKRGNHDEPAKNLTDLDDAQHPEAYGFDPNDPANVAARENAAAKRREHVEALETEKGYYEQRGDTDQLKLVDEQLKNFRDGDRSKTRTA